VSRAASVLMNSRSSLLRNEPEKAYSRGGWRVGWGRTRLAPPTAQSGETNVNSFIQLILQLHGDTVWLILALGAATLVCGLYLIYRSRGRAAGADTGENAGITGITGITGPMQLFRRLLLATAAIGVLQAIFGGILYIDGLRPAEGLHFVYGLIVLGAIPVAYVYSDQKQVRRDIIIMSIAAVAIIGAAVRAFMTGAPS
jgi:hypothetical protein